MTLQPWLAAWSDPAAWRALRGVLGGQLLQEGLRYLVFAGLFWFALHRWLRRRLQRRVIAGWPTAADLRREIAYSLSSLCVFAGIGGALFALIVSGHATIYREPARYGWWWLGASLPLLLIWHDFYFYWTHRLLHRRWLFRHVHGVHHRSRHPSPFAAYAFHPVEALVNGLVTPLALLAVPLHWSVLLAFGLHQIIRNAHGHAAVEIMPRGFARHALGGRFTTTTHHHLHHETAQGNYGLWFTWWDRWCGTERPDYGARFALATLPRR
ncbi:MAG: sterol desaturase family protein [Burkholderiales bacterium]|nr:sterol desaturase family protein [Burkholderiales bacterium]MDE1926621.1 sterol desaturase family protein [Burkholderiales bacterium]MDE2160344.1 sterol desaturase family protein [Burkholderiales bacterium]MDE2502432.1 sterol desaturase family protein [Burkholderiales bacterium]